MKNQKIKTIIFKIILEIIAVALIIQFFSNSSFIQGIDNPENVTYTLMNDISYTEITDKISNPERGFYQPIYFRMEPTSCTPITSGHKLIHLRIDISSFSKAVNGVKDLELTDIALAGLNQTLANIKESGGSVILRFAYDDHFNGNKDKEPSLTMILKHIEQLKPVFETNKDVISYIELGLFGPYGEMHTSKICTTENVSQAIDAMLESAPEEIKIGVRTPKYYTEWAKIDRSKIDDPSNITKKGTKAYRIGLYNDGYLGSETDLGTYANRTKEIAWLEQQAKHTLYGGEVVANYATGTPLNTVAYMSQEAFKTHTSYLNIEWNNTVINSWKNTEKYNGEDKLYVGLSGFQYIDNHLGYRFVLRKSEVVNKIEANENVRLKLEIENVGFANLINSKVVTIVLSNGTKSYEIPTKIDATTWDSKEKANVDIEVPLPKNIELGDWNIYLRISKYGNMATDKNYQCIQLANANIWNSTMGANYIGKVTVSEITKPQNPNDTDKPNDPVEVDKPSNIEDPSTPNKPEDQNTPDKTDNTNKPGATDNKNDGNTQTPPKGDNSAYNGKIPQTGNIELISIASIIIIIANIAINYIKFKKY